VGNGFVLVGDASMFVDPIFSSGVLLAMRGAYFAVEAIHEAFQANDFSAAALDSYEERIRRPMSRIFKMIYNWYKILDNKDPNNLFALSQRFPFLREKLIVLFSGGYDRAELDPLADPTDPTNVAPLQRQRQETSVV
jgi:halogenation protein CepH